MKTRGLAPSLLVVSLSQIGCPSPDPEPGEDGSQSTTEASSAESSSTGDAGTRGTPDAETTDAETGSTTGVVPNDCSCYAPAVDADLEFDELCISRQDALPGCNDEAPPCEPILESMVGFRSDVNVGPEEAVRCVAERLADGDRPRFDVAYESPEGGENNDYVPLADGRYVSFRCGLTGSPQYYQSVETYDVADASHFAACIADNPDDVQALHACIRAGFTEAGDPLLAC